VIVASANPVVAKYEGNSAAYSNDLYLERDGLMSLVATGMLVAASRRRR
jgi:hypothetical protein